MGPLWPVTHHFSLMSIDTSFFHTPTAATIGPLPSFMMKTKPVFIHPTIIHRHVSTHILYCLTYVVTAGLQDANLLASVVAVLHWGRDR